MKVIETRICADCDEVFEGNVCPVCADEHGLWLANIIKPMPGAAKKTLLEKIADAAAAQEGDRLAGLESLQ